MKHLLTSLIIVSLCSVAQANKEPVKNPSKPQPQPAAMVCKIMQVEEGKDGKEDIITAIEGSEFEVELMKVESHVYAGTARIKQAPHKELAAYAEVKRLSDKKQSIKMKVSRLADGAVTQSAAGNNQDDLTSPDVDVALSKSEIVACSLIEE